MSFWGRLFGTDKAIEKTIDTVSNGLDKLYYSDEEKAEDAAKDRSEARQMIVRWMEATSGQNLARRTLAIAITFTWLGMYIIAAIGEMIAVWAKSPERWMQSSVTIFEYAQGLNSAVMLILGFYFAAPYMGDIARSFGTKKNNNPS